MKKVLKSFALTGSMLAIAATAQAANTAQVTLTSPAIVKSGCERVGSYTITFDQGTILEEGDWFFMDLPSNTSICNTIDYMIGAGRAAGDTTNTITYPSVANGAANADLNVVTAIPALAPGVAAGPLTNNIIAGTGAPLSVTGGGVVLRVYAPANGRRVWVYVYGTTAAADALEVQNVVTDISTLSLHLLDGQRYTGNVILNNSGKTDLNTTSLSTVWGDATTDDIGLDNGAEYVLAHNVPNVENTLCVNAEAMSGDLMFTSFNSLNSFLTFTGDAQIAHVATANAISLISCSGKISKPTEGDILIGGQNQCSFEYENPDDFCTAAPATFSGNRMLIKGASTFGDPGDRYDMVVTSATSGIYFGGNPAVYGYTPSQTTDTDCAGFGTNITPVFSFGNTGVTAFDAGTCSVASNKRATILTTGSVGAITGIDTFDTLFVDLPVMVYDTSIIGAGVEANVTVSMSKYPCGTIFSATRTLGTFVTSCPTTVAGGTDLLYPFFPAMDGTMTGWWGGFTIVNGSSAAGTCTLTLTDAENDNATYTTTSIAAGGQWTPDGGMEDFLAALTPGTGNVGNANVAIAAHCTFSKGGGFAFTGNGNEGTGYTAYVLDSNGIWQ